MINALKLIIARSPRASMEAITTLRAVGAKSPIVALRYNSTLSMALSDPDATFTAEEREILANAIPDDSDGQPVMFPMSFRITADERARLQAEADAETDGNLSRLIRRKLLG